MVRGLRNWKKDTLADFARVSLSTVERVERGEKVSDDCLDRIAQALGYEMGAFSTPRLRLPREDAVAQMAEEYGSLQPVAVRPQNQVRSIARCQVYHMHHPDLDAAYDDQVAELAEWFDLASFVLGSEFVDTDAGEEGGVSSTAISLTRSGAWNGGVSPR